MRRTTLDRSFLKIFNYLSVAQFTFFPIIIIDLTSLQSHHPAFNMSFYSMWQWCTELPGQITKNVSLKGTGKMTRLTRSVWPLMLLLGLAAWSDELWKNRLAFYTKMNQCSYMKECWGYVILIIPRKFLYLRDYDKDIGIFHSSIKHIKYKGTGHYFSVARGGGTEFILDATSKVEIPFISSKKKNHNPPPIHPDK
jgi:hypothetical protein